MEIRFLTKKSFKSKQINKKTSKSGDLQLCIWRRKMYTMHLSKLKKTCKPFYSFKVQRAVPKTAQNKTKVFENVGNTNWKWSKDHFRCFVVNHFSHSLDHFRCFVVDHFPNSLDHFRCFIRRRQQTISIHWLMWLFEFLSLRFKKKIKKWLPQY